MYTGIVDHYGTIKAVENHINSLHVWIENRFTQIEEGESIAIDGICVTAVNPKDHLFEADISPETLRLTTAGEFGAGRRINLERSLRVGDRIGGHWVMGHVDCRARLASLRPEQEFIEMTFDGLDSSMIQYMIKKGSIAVNGVSLTLNEVLPNGFQVMLIPHTLERTNLQFLKEKDWVNIEFDMMTRIIINQLKELPLIEKLQSL